MDEENFYERPSKSAAKRAHQARQALVEQLCKVKEERLRQLDLPELFRDELQLARSMKGSSARNRQIRFLTTLFNDLDETQQLAVEQILNRP